MRVAIAAVLLAACHTVPPPAATAPGFVSQSQRESACLDLQDHAVDTYARQYISEQRLEMMPAEKFRAFRDAWAEELAKRGSFDRFQASCFASLTPNKYVCGMAAKDSETLTACMRLER